VKNYLFNDDNFNDITESFQSRNNITKENLYRLKEILLNNSTMTDEIKFESVKLIKIDDPLFTPFIKYENNTSSQKINNLIHVIEINDILISVINDTEKVKRFKSLNIPFINKLMNSTKNDENVQNIRLSVELFRLFFNEGLKYKDFVIEIKKLRNEYKNKVSKNNILILNMDVFINVFIVKCMNSINCKTNCIHKECNTSCDEWIKKEDQRIENNRIKSKKDSTDAFNEQAKKSKYDYSSYAKKKYSDNIVYSKNFIDNDYNNKIRAINRGYDNITQKKNDEYDNLINNSINAISRNNRWWWGWWNIENKQNSIRDSLNRKRDVEISKLNKERDNKIDNLNTNIPVDKTNMEKNLIKQRNIEITGVNIEIDKQTENNKINRFKEIDKIFLDEKVKKERYIQENCQECKKKNEHDCLHILIPNIRKATFDSLLNSFNFDSLMNNF
jgi:hypothetical protein